jgi:hypothetical protein
MRILGRVSINDMLLHFSAYVLPSSLPVIGFESVGEESSQAPRRLFWRASSKSPSISRRAGLLMPQTERALVDTFCWLLSSAN